MISQGKLVEDILAILEQRHNVPYVSEQQLNAVIDAANLLVRTFESQEDAKLSSFSPMPVSFFRR